MTKIQVDTASLYEAADSIARAKMRSAVAVALTGSAVKSLDMRIKARENVDERILRLQKAVRLQEERLQAHQVYLRHSAGRYGACDQNLTNQQKGAGRGAGQWAGEAAAEFLRERWRGPKTWERILEGIAFAGGQVTYKVAKEFLKQYGKFLKDHSALAAITGFGDPNSLVAKWVGRVTKAAKVVSWVTAAWKAYEEFKNSTGSMARRVSNAVVEGVAGKVGGAVGGTVGAKLGGLGGMKLGAMIGAVGGPGGVLVGAAIGGVVGAVGGSLLGGWAGSEGASALVNVKLWGKSAKERVGDVVDATVKSAPRAINAAVESVKTGAAAVGNAVSSLFGFGNATLQGASA